MDMNKRLSTVSLNLESVRRAKNRYNCVEKKIRHIVSRSASLDIARHARGRRHHHRPRAALGLSRANHASSHLDQKLQVNIVRLRRRAAGLLVAPTGDEINSLLASKSHHRARTSSVTAHHQPRAQSSQNPTPAHRPSRHRPSRPHATRASTAPRAIDALDFHRRRPLARHRGRRRVPWL